MLLCELWVHLASPERDSPGAMGHFLSTNTPSRSVTAALRCGWERCIGWAAILKCGAATTVATTTTSSVQPDGVAGCGMSVGQRPWEHMPNSPVSRSNIINGSGRWYSFGASDSSTQNSVQCGWFLFTDWFKFLTHWSAITAFYMLSVLHETKCRRIPFIKVMIDSSTQNTVQCGWFCSRIWLKVSNSLVCNHSILHARGLHETKCWGIFFVSGLISLFSTENTTSKKIFMENWNNLQHVHINRIYKAIDSRSGQLTNYWNRKRLSRGPS